MNNQRARHPLISGTFSRTGDEIKAARGKTSSREFEEAAQLHEQNAEKAELFAAHHARQIQQIEHAAALLIAEHPAQRQEIEAEAEQHKQGAEITKERDLIEAQRSREHAEQQRRYAQQARDFEARFGFDVYTDKALDALEKQQREAKAKPRRKAR